MNRMQKVYFPIESDGDGYPPVQGENLWAMVLADGLYRLDNVPFFARGVSLGDDIKAEIVNGTPTYAGVAHRGGHSTIRVAIADEQDVQGIRDDLRRLGCSTELSHLPRLISCDIPPDVGTDDVLRYLESGRAGGRIDYEVADIAAA